MKFSIVIPLYNKEKHIKRAMDSVLQQTYKDFELVVVDDGSTDSSYKIASSVKDPRVKILSKKNGGVSSARNYGILCSSYDYIGFLDADDVWKPTFLESIYKLIKKYPEAGAYATLYEFRNGDISKTANINVNLKDGKSAVVDYFKGALFDPMISSSSVVIGKYVFDSIGQFSTDLNRGEDLEMWCRIAMMYQIVFLNKVLATYFQDSENKLTNTQRIYSNSFMNRVEDILIEQKKLGKSSCYFEEYMIKMLMSKIRYLIKNKKNKEARELLWKYKYTRYNKKKWFEYYILSFRPIYFLYRSLSKI